MNDHTVNKDVSCSNCDDSVLENQNRLSLEKLKGFVKGDFWYVNYILIMKWKIPKKG